MLHDDAVDASLFQQFMNAPKHRSWHIDEFRMKRLGKKDYIFVHETDKGADQRYRCSHLEARRRFAQAIVLRNITLR